MRVRRGWQNRWCSFFLRQEACGNENWGREGLSMGTDSVAAKGILNRVGSGAVKHMSVKHMWGQQLVRQHQVRVYKIARDDNVSYVLASTASLSKSRELLERGGIHVVRIEDCLAVRNKGGRPIDFTFSKFGHKEMFACTHLRPARLPASFNWPSPASTLANGQPCVNSQG